MATNRRRHPNAVPLVSIFTWITVCLVLCGAGLWYVYLKNQIHATGTTIKKLEQTLADLNTQDEAVRSKIATLSSHAALQKRLSDGFVKLVPISDDRLVRLEAPAPAAKTELRAVSNERTRE